MGFQTDDPATDLRVGGVLGLYALVNLAERHAAIWKRLQGENAPK
jgi:hypothetical protein